MGLLGFGAGVARGLSGDIQQRKAETREDELLARKEELDLFRATLPTLIEEARASGDWAGLESHIEEMFPQTAALLRKRIGAAGAGQGGTGATPARRVAGPD